MSGKKKEILLPEISNWIIRENYRYHLFNFKTRGEQKKIEQTIKKFTEQFEGYALWYGSKSMMLVKYE